MPITAYDPLIPARTTTLTDILIAVKSDSQVGQFTKQLSVKSVSNGPR